MFDRNDKQPGHSEKWCCSLHFMSRKGLRSTLAAEKTVPLVEYIIIPSQRSGFNLEMRHFPLTTSSWFANILLKRFTVAPSLFFNNIY